MKKALYLHGFLGGPQDMEPLYLKNYSCNPYDLKTLLFEEDYIQKLANDIDEYEFICGYSFGGRILEELKSRFPGKAKKWIFVSSRHTPYPKEEFVERESFRGLLYSKLDDRAKFFEYWRTLSLFDGHQMDEYRARYKLGYTPWTNEEIERYLGFFFNSPQVEPLECTKSNFIHGLEDSKYFEEGKRLKNIFNVFTASGGHRFLFEKPDQFKFLLKEIVS